MLRRYGELDVGKPVSFGGRHVGLDVSRPLAVQFDDGDTAYLAWLLAHRRDMCSTAAGGIPTITWFCTDPAAIACARIRRRRAPGPSRSATTCCYIPWPQNQLQRISQQLRAARSAPRSDTENVSRIIDFSYSLKARKWSRCAAIKSGTAIRTNCVTMLTISSAFALS